MPLAVILVWKTRDQNLRISVANVWRDIIKRIRLVTYIVLKIYWKATAMYVYCVLKEWIAKLLKEFHSTPRLLDLVFGASME